MNYGAPGSSWLHYKNENWRATQQSPSHFFGAPNPSYSYNPYEQHTFHGPDRSQGHRDMYAAYRDHRNPTGHWPNRANPPYMMPPQPYFRQEEPPQPVFITPNAGMEANLKVCASDIITQLDNNRENYENFGSNDESIMVKVKPSQFVAFVEWSLSARFKSSDYYYSVELYLYKEKRMADHVKIQDLRKTSCQFKTTPGQDYQLVVNLIRRTDQQMRIQGVCLFKSHFSFTELNELYNMATRFAGKEPVQSFKYLYRVKPQVYFDDIQNRTSGVMEKYIKDDNGHVANPINGEIRGLFFSAQLHNNYFPQFSPFGDKRFYINAERLLSPDNVNVYFADFYCTSKTHYVTIIVCKQNSTRDIFCKSRLKKLDFFNNAFLKIQVSSVNDQLQYNYFVNDCVRVEICYTENVHLSQGYFEDVASVGIGSSKVGGLPNNPKCKICNLTKNMDSLLAEISSEVPKQKNTMSKSAPVVPKSPPTIINSGQISSKQPASKQSQQTSKDNNKQPITTITLVEDELPDIIEIPQPVKKVQKETPLRRIIKNDRKQRNYADPDQEVVKVLNALIDSVGAQIELEEFTQKIKEGILDYSRTSESELHRGSWLINSLLYDDHSYINIK